MPIANKYSVDELISACKRYIAKTGRRISFEYALIAGINDSVEDAHAVGRLLSGMLCHLNLIPVNPIKEKNYRKSEKNAIKVFTETIETYKITVVPTVVFVDKQGKIAYKKEGIIEEFEIKNNLEMIK